MPTSDTLRTLADERQIVDCIVRLFVATDRRDWATVRACFTDVVRFDMTSLAGGAPADVPAGQIIAGWTEGLAPMEAVHHHLGNFRVTVRRGDEADAFCYGTAYHYRRTASGRNTRTFVGSYDFTLIRADDAWRINAFRFNVKFVDGNLELEKDG